VLDAVAKILGLEPEDFGLAAVTPFFLSGVLDFLPSMVVGVLVGLALYFAKRGQAPGALFHALHWFGIIRLPGILPPSSQRYSPW
jgi:hypothetical protein